jgi:hypothetical protein
MPNKRARKRRRAALSVQQGVVFINELTPKWLGHRLIIDCDHGLPIVDVALRVQSGMPMAYRVLVSVALQQNRIRMSMKY